MRMLSPRNPLDYLRLLSWLFIYPDRLRAHNARFGEAAAYRVGKWFVSTTTWLPLFVTTMALRLGSWSSGAADDGRDVYLILAAAVVTAWALQSIFGDRDVDLLNHTIFILIALVTIGTIVALLMIGRQQRLSALLPAVLMLYIIGVYVAGSWRGDRALSGADHGKYFVPLFLGLGVIIAIFVDGGLGGILTLALVFMVGSVLAAGLISLLINLLYEDQIDTAAMMTIASVACAMFVTVGVVIEQMVGVMGLFVALFMAASSAVVLDRQLRTGRSVWLSWFILFPVSSAYTFLIWVMFFNDVTTAI